jgi:pimeloyl-ACP methyl ester carboxylesterase
MQLQPISFLQSRLAQPDLPLFVFFPGMDATGKLLYKQIDSLATRFDLRCLAIATNDRTDWPELVDLSLELIATERLEGRELYLCGESFGACWAMQVAAKIQAKINKLVLINPASSLVRLSSFLPDAMYPLSVRSFSHP